jgi:MOSC domain-containing protein YiiM
LRAFTPLLSLRVGRVAPLGVEGLPSAIDKQPVASALAVNWLGLAGDQQADRTHHGGVDKALHHYPAEHYPVWRVSLPDRAAAFEIGAFGENIATLGMTEDSVCLGDIYRLGGAVLQVSQGRSPCRKLNLRFGVPDMVARVRDSGHTGWYYRVLEEGLAGPGDSLALLERPHPPWTVARLFAELFRHGAAEDSLEELLELTALATNWRQRAEQRLRDLGRPAWLKGWGGGR